MVDENERPNSSPKSQADLDRHQPRMWRCGQEYQYPIPKPDGNPWEVVLESLLKKDQVQCAAWKDEVQNLLIFAGLFSAVVTSFVVQSYQALKPGSNDLAVLLLARIASQLENKNATNIISLNQEIPSTTSLLSLSSASPSDLRVNTFWFLSLVLSLTTVLVGIVSLQWLRAHQHYNDSLSPRLALGIYHMRAQALERWYVPQVFATLPLLLQVALVLFFAGLIDFLLQLAPSVAVPVTVAVGATVVFLVVTTVLPSLQCLFVSLRQPLSNDPVPSPCPYKSPQSLAFKRLITLSRRAFCAIHELSIFSLYLLKFTLPQTLSRLLRQGGIKYIGDTWKYRLFSHRAYLFWASPHWIEFDRTWLILRNEHFDITRVHADGTGPSPTSFADPIYDSIRALGMATKSNEHHEGVIFAAYHCFQDVSLSAKDEGGYPNDHLQACYRDLVPTWNSPIVNIASMVVDPSAELAHDIHSVLFLRIPGIFYKAINPAHVFGKHMLELHTRILGTLFAHGPCGLSEGIQPGPTGFFHWYTINLASLHFDPDMQDGEHFLFLRRCVQLLMLSFASVSRAIFHHF
ncbi:hypothetical protein CVT26_007650 [Gymnopilus dilepis]|uniref:DUF6535 domain-containing protein n=1 Tax=Gymnopilus dilepis TaxID=231916 RepID=A0A409VZM5_9AGAR|nr:hypothetical protein CVT26_007650 [Gymnopilus dilepis]